MKEILNSYRTTELRSLVKEHNKKIRKEISEEIKQIRKNIKAKRLINIVGKKRDEIIDKLRKTEFIAGNFGANKRVLEKAEKEL